jgi:hypothetical protein
MDIEVGRGPGCENHRPTAAKQSKHRVWKLRTSHAVLEREQFKQEMKKDPRLTSGLSSN